MSFVKIIENMELEIQNNDAFGEATNHRYESLKAVAVALHGQAAIFVEQLAKLISDIDASNAASNDEFVNRKKAMHSMIGSEDL